MRKVRILFIILFFGNNVIAQSVGIGTENPSISSKLEVNSTTQGFLLPRMNYQQRISIQNPAKGLQVFQTDSISGLYIFTGNKWSVFKTGEMTLTTNGTSGLATYVNDTLNIPQLQNTLLIKHTVGEIYGGGVVFYITPDSLHGIVVETIDQTANVSMYEAQDAINNPNNHSQAGKNFLDWRFPSKSELIMLYAARNSGIIANFVNGGFYWSSTETNYSIVWTHALTSANGYMSPMNKANTTGFYTRTVRSF